MQQALCGGGSVSIYAGEAFLFFLLQIGTPQGAAILVRSSQSETRKGWLTTYLILLPHMPALFVASLIDCWTQNGS